MATAMVERVPGGLALEQLAYTAIAASVHPKLAFIVSSSFESLESGCHVIGYGMLLSPMVLAHGNISHRPGPMHFEEKSTVSC